MQNLHYTCVRVLELCIWKTNSGRFATPKKIGSVLEDRSLIFQIITTSNTTLETF